MKFILKTIFTVASMVCFFEANQQITQLTLSSPHYILIDADYRTVLAKKNDQETIYPASTTKVMTALTVQTLFDIDPNELLQSTSLAIRSTTKKA